MTPSFSDILIDDDFLLEDDEDLLFGDEDLLFDEDEPEEIEEESADSWKIMIVDDDIKVHLVTKLSLKNFRFDNKPLSFVSAYSGQEAKQLIQEHPYLALILLDVVMETNSAGLMVAKHIREVLHNDQVRIILRTGQPGQAPEESVILAYDINDYKTKTELTQQKLFTTIMSALRSYRDITTIKASRAELQALYANLAKRNAELKQANQQLQEEIVERQKLEAIRLEQERLRIENEFLEKQSRELAKLNADKDKFFSIVAHDLKNPFQPLLGYSELLFLAPEMLSPGKIQQIGTLIHDSAKNIYELLENLLQWARMQMGRMVYQPVVLNFAELVAQNIKLLGENALKKQIRLHSSVSDQLFVYADKNMLNTIIRNLVSNALKFTSPEGQVTISAQRARRLRHGEGLTEWVEISVADTGVGIHPEDLDRLFQIDSHITTQGTASEQGTGLGLIICKEMVEMNGGQIWIESQLGEGTAVKFTVQRSQS